MSKFLHLFLFVFFLHLQTSHAVVMESKQNIQSTGNITEKSAKVRNGANAKQNQFPYQISLQSILTKYRHICGGSIVSMNKILTAAHCVTKNNIKYPPFFYRVMAGSISVHQTQINKLVRQIYVHPKYDYRNIAPDFAILIIEGVYDFNGLSIKPIEMAVNRPSVGTNCVVSGWGQISATTLPEILQFAYVKIDDQEYCEERFMNEIKITSDMVCAGGFDESDADRGDSGGPLVCDDKLVGIVSFGMSPDQNFRNYPGVYSSVPDQLEWIEENSGMILHKNYVKILVSSFIYLIIISALFE